MTCVGRCEHGYPCHERCDSCRLLQFPEGPEREKNRQMLLRHYDSIEKILNHKSDRNRDDDNWLTTFILIIGGAVLIALITNLITAV